VEIHTHTLLSRYGYGKDTSPLFYPS